MRDKSVHYLLLFLIVMGIFLGVYEGIWKEGAKKTANTNVNIADDQSETIYLEVIWDASGSMWGRDYGVEKILRSKEVLKTFNDKLPENINIGLRIFGARRVGDLKDSFLAIPFSENNRENIINFITNVKPLGKSPIAFSLQEACHDLKDVQGARYIILISDGIDNGEIPPEDVIDELINENIVLHIVHIGEPEDQDIKGKLKNMAEQTGGKYFTYTDHENVIATFLQ